jgi:putative methanogenesis marker protein 17
MSEEDESFAFQNFDTIFRQILQDLGVTRSVEAFKILADPEEPYFLVSLKLGRARNAIKVSDMAQLNEHTGGTAITITDENWAPALLTKLWQQYGRDRIEQLTRFELLVHGASVDELTSLQLDPGEELKSKLLDAVWRMFPEGFKVRYEVADEKAMTIIGTEHDMKQKWIDLAQRTQREMRDAEAP